MAWITGWCRRKSHVVQQKVGAGTLYQVGIKVYKGAGADGTEVVNGITFGKVYCGGNCQNDFGDIRFADSVGDGLLDYWMEELSAGTYAIFWVEVTDDLSTANRTIYIYYDTAGATVTTSNGDTTFRLFDHFNDGVLDLAKWNTGGIGTTVEAGTELTITSGGANADHRHVTSKIIYTTGVAVELRLRRSVDVGIAWAGMTSVVGSALSTNYIYSFMSRTLYANFCWCSGDDVNFNIAQYTIVRDLNYHRSSTKRTGIDDDLFVDSEENAGAEFPTANDRYVSMNAYNLAGAVGALVVDWVAVRKYVDPEPTHGSWGGEELGPPPTQLQACCECI